MNSRTTTTSARPSGSGLKADPLFAPGVYEEEDAEPASKDPIGEELAQLRAELRGEARALRFALSRPRVPAELLAELASLRATVDMLLSAPKKGTEVAAILRARGIEGAAALAFERAVKDKETSPESILDRLRTALGALVHTGPSMEVLMRGSRSIVALVGPAGVGKTTTAAKLAARARMAGRSVALVSCDAFRVGAMDQLGKYADLMDARFHTATTSDELMDILRTETADVIIVDTSGRPVEADATEFQLGAAELRASERLRRKVEVLLCVPASLRAADAARVHRDFSATKPTALVVTKLDETDTPAGLVHAVFATKLPVSTLCAGQRVPEDIEEAEPSAIAERLFPTGNPEARKGSRGA